MPTPRDRSQLTPWLKQHGYKWVLQSPRGEIVSVANAILAIEQAESSIEEMHIGDDPLILTGDVYHTDAAWGTGCILGTWHDDDTGEFEIMIDGPDKQEEKDGVIWYTFSNGAVLVRHDHVLKTEQEWKEELQSQKPEQELEHR